mmetsp:Transcript_28696/g.46482  ORF Transcript_28696/g.46482 Transcript_28696/m.46482 type:complete len:93 (+) Transcript_28696:239-517(+)
MIWGQLHGLCEVLYEEHVNRGVRSRVGWDWRPDLTFMIEMDATLKKTISKQQDKNRKERAIKTISTESTQTVQIALFLVWYERCGLRMGWSC